MAREVYRGSYILTIGEILASNGSMPFGRLREMLKAKIKPEHAFRRADSMKGPRRDPSQDGKIAFGRTVISNQAIRQLQQSSYVKEGEDGSVTATPKFRRDFPEAFTEETRSRKDLHEIYLFMVTKLVENNDLGGSRAAGMREIMRQILRMCDRDVEGGVGFGRKDSRIRIQEGGTDNGEAELAVKLKE